MASKNKKAEEKDKGGRPRTYALELPVYDSMQQMAKHTGIPIHWLKLAKREGCIFVQHGRCHLSVFLDWFFKRTEGDEDEDWAKRDKRASALIREEQLMKARDQVVEFDTVRRFVNHLMAVSFFGELDRIAHEFPASLKGKTELEIHAECIAQVGRVKKTVESQIKTWVNKKGKV